jgi:acyl-coenzyme A synthetase/AMP-(fatty) acid ligase
MAPTEYRAIAKRSELRPLPSLRHAVAAGEPLNPEIVELWREQVGVSIHDGYGQTETGALTGMPIGRPVRPGSMGKPLPRFKMWIENGELVLDPSSIPTITIDAPPGTWHTGDRVREDEDGYLWFEGRADDVIISAGYRIGPFEVESALVAHEAVAEAAAVAAPDEVRGAIVRAVVVLRDGYAGSDQLVADLQDHVKAETAPYKYPRIVEFVDALPKTASGKIKRAELRG